MDLLALLIALLAIIFVAAIVYLPIILGLYWVPRTKKLRISEKRKGKYLFYRAEFYRPIFGWTGFWCSRFSDKIFISNTWEYNRETCERSIETYKNFKNLN